MNSTDIITAHLIIEVLGKPPEHLTETLQKIVEGIGKEKGIEVLDSTVHPPQTVKDRDDFFSSFVEVEIRAETIFEVTTLIFKYMPAHFEIASPERLTMTNNDWGTVLNEITRKLHGYDEIARVVQVEKHILEKQVRSLKEQLEKKS